MDFFLISGFIDVFLALGSLERRSLIMCLCNSLSRMSPSSPGCSLELLDEELLDDKLLDDELLDDELLDEEILDETLGSAAALSLWTLLDSMALLNTLTMNTTRVRRARKLTVSSTKVLVFTLEGMKTCLLVLIKSESWRGSPLLSVMSLS